MSSRFIEFTALCIYILSAYKDHYYHLATAFSGYIPNYVAPTSAPDPLLLKLLDSLNTLSSLSIPPTKRLNYHQLGLRWLLLDCGFFFTNFGFLPACRCGSLSSKLSYYYSRLGRWFQPFFKLLFYRHLGPPLDLRVNLRCQADESSH